MRGHFLYSTIFEKEEEAKMNPFVFEKQSPLEKRLESYPKTKFEGSLYKKSKHKDNELKERYYIFSENKLIQFKVHQRIFPPF